MKKAPGAEAGASSRIGRPSGPATTRCGLKNAFLASTAKAPRQLPLIGGIGTRPRRDADRARREAHRFPTFVARELHRRHCAVFVRDRFLRREALDEAHPLLEAFLDLLVVEAIRRGFRASSADRRSTRHPNDRAAGRSAARAPRPAPRARSARTARPCSSASPESAFPRGRSATPTFLTFDRGERLEPLEDLLDLHHIVGEQLGRGVDRREPPPITIAGRRTWRFESESRLEGPRELQCHQEVRGLADPTR